MNCKTIIQKRGLLLLMAWAGLAAALTSCGDDDEIKVVENPSRELSTKLTLKNEQGQETTTFKEGENIFFCLTTNYSCTSPKYSYFTRVWDLFGIVPIENVFVPMSLEMVNVATELADGYLDEDRPVAMAVFTADGQFVGYPMDIIYSGQQQIQPGDSIYYECPWMTVGDQTVYSSIFGKTTQRNPLSAGKYYSCNVTLDETTLPHCVSYIKNRVDFTVEAQ